MERNEKGGTENDIGKQKGDKTKKGLMDWLNDWMIDWLTDWTSNKKGKYFYQEIVIEITNHVQR